MQARIRRGVMFRELGNENTPGPPEPLLQLDQANPRGFRPLSALDKIDKDGLSFSEARDSRSFKSRDVDEHIFAAAVPCDEAVAPFGIEPLHRAGLLDAGETASRIPPT